MFFTKSLGSSDLPDDSPPPALDVSPGTGISIEGLPAGWTPHLIDPQHPVQAYADFVKAKQREISAGLNISHFSLTTDLTEVNYTSSRTGLLEDRCYYMSLQNFLISRFLTPIFRKWLAYNLKSGLLYVGTTKALPFEKYNKFAMHTWIPRRWQWVDPEKEVNAYLKAIDNNLISKQRVMAETGLDA
jgi:lambda family phage portal protein